MALISMRQMLDHAAEFEYGIPAFNVNNLELSCRLWIKYWIDCLINELFILINRF